MKTIVILDVASLAKAASEKYGNRRLDFKELKEKVERLTINTGDHTFVAYLGTINDKQLQFANFLNSHDIRIDESPNRVIKICTDVVRWCTRYDQIVLCTNNPAFDELVKLVNDEGVTCYVGGIQLPRQLRFTASKTFEFGEDCLRPIHKKPSGVPEENTNPNIDYLSGTSGNGENPPEPESSLLTDI